MSTFEPAVLVAGGVTAGWAIAKFTVVLRRRRRPNRQPGERYAWLRAPRSSVALRWLWRRMMVAYALCPVVMAVIVAVGRGHRLAALVLLFTAFLGTNAYVVMCGLRALVVAPGYRPEEPAPSETLANDASEADERTA